MSTLQIGLAYGGATLAFLFSGIPIAFALGAVATLFMLLFMPPASLDTVAQAVYEELSSITLLTIPLFILKGAAIGKTRAGKDLYDALHTWMHRVPAGSGWRSPSPAGCSPQWPGRCRQPVRRSAVRASPRCAGAAIRPASPPA